MSSPRPSEPRRALLALLALLVLLAAAGCGGGCSGDGEVARAGDETTGDEATGDETTDDREATTTTRVVACEAGDLDPRTLAPVVIEEVDGFTQQADDVGDTGPSDLAKAILDDGEPDAERVLNETGFRAGYQRLWEDGAGDEVLVVVSEFCNEDGAERYGNRPIEVLDARGVPIQPVVGAEVGTGITLGRQSERALWLWESSGPVLVMVAAYTEQATEAAVLLDRATAVLAAQLERLAPEAAGPA